MDFDWYFRLPDFGNLEAWAELALFDFYFDPRTVSIREDRNYGCGPKNLILGMAIRKEHVSNPDLLLMEYRSLDGKGPFVLKWWSKKLVGMSGHAIKVDGVWRIKAEGQVVFWKVIYDEQKKQTRSVTVTLETASLPPEN